MCGRYSNRFTWKELVELYRAFLDPNAPPSIWTPKYNIAPTTQIPVLRYVDGKRRLDLMRWGLVPSWAKEIGKFATHNARSDGCESKPLYRGAWKAGRRCVIPASSFFEWRQTDKKPYAIGMGNQGPLSIAGLWEENKLEGATLSATMITTEPNSLMEPIHNRMPVLLGDESLAAWLGEENASPDDLRELLKPFPAKRMSLWPVSKDVGNVRNQNADLIDPIKDPESR